MIKWIRSLIEKVFGKFCKCKEPTILEDEEQWLKDEARMAQYLEDKIIEPIVCTKHSRFIKSCAVCIEAAK